MRIEGVKRCAECALRTGKGVTWVHTRLGLSKSTITRLKAASPLLTTGRTSLNKSNSYGNNRPDPEVQERKRREAVDVARRKQERRAERRASKDEIIRKHGLRCDDLSDAMVWYYRNHEKSKANSRESAKRTYAKRGEHGRVRAKLHVAFHRWVRLGHRHKILLSAVGCSLDELKTHLESKFSPGMSWENYGRCGWELDHIFPQSLFDYSDPDDVRAAWHFENLRPLWSSVNRMRRRRWRHE